MGNEHVIPGKMRHIAAKIYYCFEALIMAEFELQRKVVMGKGGAVNTLHWRLVLIVMSKVLRYENRHC